MVLKTPETSEDRILNREMVLKDLKAHPNSILGIYRIKPKTTMYTVTSLARPANLI